MRVLLSSILTAATMAYGAMPCTAFAAAHLRVQPMDCGALAAEIGPRNVWQTWFQGSRQGLFQRENDAEAPCFDTLAKCTAWLYWAQSDWPQENSFQPCRKGPSE